MKKKRSPSLSAIPFLILLLLYTTVASGSQADSAVDESEELPSTGDTVIDTIQEKASESLLDTAEWFDDFFDDSRHFAELNQSRAKLKLSFKYHQDDGLDISPSIQWRIHLPKISKKTNLILFFSEDSDEDDFSTGPNDSSYNDDRFQDEIGAAVKQFLKIGKHYNISGTVGGSTSYLYAGLRWRYLWSVGEWESRFVERLRYYTDDGWENVVSLDMERNFMENWLFRSTFSLYWYEEDDGLPHDLSFTLYQFLSPRRALSYEWLNSFETDPSYQLSLMRFQIRYRQRIHRNWLLYEVKPRLEFLEENDREPEFSIFFILEAKFGREERKALQNVFQF